MCLETDAMVRVEGDGAERTSSENVPLRGIETRRRDDPCLAALQGSERMGGERRRSGGEVQRKEMETRWS
jgi:hypothetical protein